VSATTAAPADAAAIGTRIRALREAMRLSLRDLAERSGVSAPMLSQVERGETSPTLSVAARIAGGLDLSLSQLLRLDEGGAVTVVRASERAAGGARSRGHSYEVVTPPRPGQRAEVSLHVLEAEDIAKAILYAVAQPEHVAVNEVMVRPTKQRR